MVLECGPMQSDKMRWIILQVHGERNYAFWLEGMLRTSKGIVMECIVSYRKYQVVFIDQLIT